MTTFIPFFVPDIGEQEIAEVMAVMQSGWLTTGPKARQFESDFAAYVGGDVQAIAVNSATAGLHLALEALGIQRGDEVITPAYTFTATAEVVRYLGADPVFADVDPVTKNVTPESVAARITRKTKAVIPVHFGGLPCDMSGIQALCRPVGIRIVEDAAHALPALHHGNMIGALESDVTVFSFYATKTITTGEGGMICTRHADIADRCRVMRLHGISRDAFDRYVSKMPSWFYEVVAPGYKYNLSDLAAAVGLAQLRRSDAFRARRAALAKRYSEGLRGLPLRLPPDAAAPDSHAWHLYVINLDASAPVARDHFIDLMSKLGIACSVHFIPLHIHPYWRDTYSCQPGDFPNALAAYESAVSLPLYTKMTEADQDRVIAAVRTILQAH